MFSSSFKKFSTLLNFFVLFQLCMCGEAFAQTQVQNNLLLRQYLGIGTTGAPAASAALQIDSVTKGMVPPRMSGTQRDAIVSPLAGTIVYNNSTGALNIWNGTVWGAIGGGVAPLTANRSVITDGSGVLAASSVTTTEHGYLSGLTSAIQTQLDAKLTNVLTTDGDLISRVGGVPARVGIGTSSFILTSNGTGFVWAAAPQGFANPMTTDGDLITRAAGVPARVAIGTSSFVLTSNGTGAVWSAPAAGGINALTGDVSAAGTGSQVATLAPITNAKIATAAGIGVTKLQALAARGVVQTDASGFLTSTGYAELQAQAVTPAAPATGFSRYFSTTALYDLFVRNDQGYVERFRPEADLGNLLENPGFDKGTTGWTANGGVLAAVAIGTSNAQGIGPATGTYDPASAAQYLQSPAVTVPRGYAGANGIARCRFQNLSGSAASHNFGMWNGTTFSTPIAISTTALAQPVEYPFVFGAEGSTIAMRFVPTGNEPLVSVDQCYIGLNDNIGSVSQASFYGGAEQSGATSCAYNQSTSTALNNYVDLSAAGSCAQAWTSYGNCTAVGPTSSSITCNNMPPGDYKMEVSAYFYANSTANNAAFFQISDGTNTFGFNTLVTVGTNQDVSGTMNARQTYTAPGSRTFKIQSSDNGTVTSGIDNSVAGQKFIWRVWRFPLASELAVRTNQQTLPTQQTFATPGTFPYTRPAGVTHIRVRMVGGGGGGAGAGAIGTPGAGGAAGAQSSFGGTILVALPGGGGTSGGAPTGGPGGGATINLPAIGIAIAGGSGAGTGVAASTNFPGGGAGGSSLFGGGGATAPGSPGGAGQAYGSGGGGAGASTAGSSYAGGGGGAGGAVDAYIYAPTNSYSVVVGGAGGGGSFGSGGQSGGNGAGGAVIVDEFYGNSPVVVPSSVTSSYNGQMRVVTATITPTSAGACTVTNNPGGEVTTTPGGVGDCTVNFAANTFLAGTTPNCQLTSRSAFVSNITQYAARVISVTNTAARIYHTYRDSTTGNVTADPVDISCTGPR